jgi:hypothetical protein
LQFDRCLLCVAVQGKPLCVLLNKRDVPGALSQSQLDTVLRLHDLRLSHPGRLQVRFSRRPQVLLCGSLAIPLQQVLLPA